MNCEKAYRLCTGMGELIGAIEQNLSALKKEELLVREQLATAKRHGLGEHLLAVDLLPQLVSRLACLDSLTSRAMANIQPVES